MIGSPGAIAADASRPDRQAGPRRRPAGARAGRRSGTGSAPEGANTTAAVAAKASTGARRLASHQMEQRLPAAAGEQGDEEVIFDDLGGAVGIGRNTVFEAAGAPDQPADELMQGAKRADETAETRPNKMVTAIIPAPRPGRGWQRMGSQYGGRRPRADQVGETMRSASRATAPNDVPTAARRPSQTNRAKKKTCARRLAVVIFMASDGGPLGRNDSKSAVPSAHSAARPSKASRAGPVEQRRAKGVGGNRVGAHHQRVGRLEISQRPAGGSVVIMLVVPSSTRRSA